MSRKQLTILHGVAFGTHLIIAGTILGFVITDPGEQWPIINRKWKNNSDMYEYYLSSLLPVFPALSCMNHLVSISNPKLYDKILKDQVNSLRWGEYAVSAGVMLWIIATLAGILEIRTLITISVLNALLQYAGYLIECAVARKASKKEISDLIIMAWGIHMSIWIQIFVSFFTVVQTSDIPSSKGPIYSIIITLFLLFSSFGILATLWANGTIQTFELLEMAYIILSLVSKTFLLFMAYFGVLRGNQPV